LFGLTLCTEAIIANIGDGTIGFVLSFHNHLTFFVCPGSCLEKLSVRSEWRDRNVDRALLWRLARIAIERCCVRIKWSVLDWNEKASGFTGTSERRG